MFKISYNNLMLPSIGVIRWIPRFISNQAYKHGNESTKNETKSMHPLKGVRILDLTRVVAGPYCTMILADMGAEVIKVERPETGDESRKWGPPFLTNSKDSLYFLACNRNKKSICVDFKLGSEVIRELAMKCDVLVENYVPGKLVKYNLDYEEIKKIAPHLIYCSLTGYGSEGPYSRRPGYDVIAASIGGLLHITGEPERPPCKVGIPVTDMVTGLYAHGAILSALLYHQKSGRGQKIDVDLFSTQVSLLINVASNFLNGELEAQRWGTSHSSIVPYQTFKTADGYLTLGAGSDDQFRALCKFLSNNELSSDPKFLTNSDRVKNRTELIEKLSSIIIKQSTAVWMKLFDKAPFPVGPVNNIREVFNDEHIKSIQLVKTLQHKTDGPIKVVGPAVKFSESKNDARTAPPVLGQHTDDILRNVLNYSNDKINQLRSNKVIQ